MVKVIIIKIYQDIYQKAADEYTRQDKKAFSNIFDAASRREVVGQESSDPDNSQFFQAGVEGREACATFIGDYNGIAVDMYNRVHGVWTDMRRIAELAPSFTVEDAFYARRE